MESLKQTLLSHLYRREFSDGAISWNDVCHQLIAEATKRQLIDVEQSTPSASVSRYWNDLLRQIEYDKRRGMVPTFDILDSQLRRFCWLPYSPSGLDAESVRKKRVVRSRRVFVSKIDALNWRQFEALSCITCEAIGSSRVHLTPSGSEGGIDFLAIVRIRKDCHVFCGNGSGLRVVGQCKKWGQKPDPDDVDYLHQTVSNVRHDDERVRDVVPPWFKSAGGPIVGWMISQTGLSEPSEELARKRGILVSESIDIAEILCASRRYRRFPTHQIDEVIAADVDAMLNRFE